MADQLTYRSTGVDLDAAERAKQSLKDLLASTQDANTLSELGSFGGLYSVPADVDGPVLVSSADGVGTKLKLAFMTGRHDTVGQCLVNHCVNDILVQGARPLFFLDYVATGHLDEGVVEDVVRGMAIACGENSCALLGGETAQMPDFYSEGEYDVAGFIVGLVAKDKLVDGSGIKPGDRLIALPSTGLHTNGYTLARAIVFDRMGLRASDPFPGEYDSAGNVLLRIHRSYLRELTPLLEKGWVNGLAHITGGGIEGNLPRVLPEGCGARVELGSWTPPNLFQVLQHHGGVAAAEMRRVFNMGIGMIVVADPDKEAAILEALGGEAWSLGEITKSSGVEFVGHHPE